VGEKTRKHLSSRGGLGLFVTKGQSKKIYIIPGNAVKKRGADSDVLRQRDTLPGGVKIKRSKGESGVKPNNPDIS